MDAARAGLIERNWLLEMEGKRIRLTVINDLSADQRMLRICGSLAKAGYKVELIGRKLPASGPLAQRAWKQTRLPCFFQKGKMAYAEFNLRLFCYLLFRPIDILCSIDCDTLPAGWLLRRLRRFKLLFDAHEWFSEVPEVISRPKVQRIWQWVERKLLPGVDGAYSVCRSVADAYQETTGIDVGVVMNAPPLAAQRRHEAQKPHVILYQGALNAGRGLEAMIDAMPKLDLQLHIIGEGDLSAELRLRAIQLGVANKVKFLGWLPPEALPEHTAAAWLGLNVSENLGKSYYYSLNNKFFDYIHSGLPSLINPFPEYLRMLEKWKVGICAESNPESLVDAIRYLQGNPEIYRDMELACLEAAQELNWENEEKKLLHWYA